MAKNKITGSRLPEDRYSNTSIAPNDLVQSVTSKPSRGNELYKPAGPRKSRSNQTGAPQKQSSTPETWSAFDNQDDIQIAEAVAKNQDAAPVDDDMWKNARVIMPVPKQPISIRLDEDVLAYFKKSGPGYQSRMNAVLRAYMDAKK